MYCGECYYVRPRTNESQSHCGCIRQIYMKATAKYVDKIFLNVLSHSECKSLLIYNYFFIIHQKEH